MFFSHYWRRREPPVCISAGEFRSSFWKLDLVFVSCENFSRFLSSGIRSLLFATNLHKETTHFVPTIGGDGSRQSPSDALVFVRVFCKTVLFYTRRKICNGKNKGLATPCVNEDQNAFALVFDFLTKMKHKIGASKLFPFGLPFSTPFSIPWNVKQECRT